MKQLTFWDAPPDERIVNVASVPQRSPFRYPGGKTWLIPRIRQWFASFPEQPAELIEPFAGGAIVGLTAAFEQLAKKVTLVELDEQVASVWQTIIEDGKGEWLAEQIGNFELTTEAVDSLLSATSLTTGERALQTIIKNRVNRGGILAPGAGRLKEGEAGKGIASRWYPQTLRKRILDIASVRARLAFVQGDGLEVIKQYADRKDVVFFIDPPYTADGKKPGSRLYTHFELNHEELFRLASTLSAHFLMTYDEIESVKRLAGYYGLEMRAVVMKTTHHTRLNELLVGRDLSWLDA